MEKQYEKDILPSKDKIFWEYSPITILVINYKPW